MDIELYPIMYEPFVGFTMHKCNREMLFKKKGKMHIADFSDTEGMNVAATKAYMKAE